MDLASFKYSSSVARIKASRSIPAPVPCSRQLPELLHFSKSLHRTQSLAENFSATMFFRDAEERSNDVRSSHSDRTVARGGRGHGSASIFLPLSQPEARRLRILSKSVVRPRLLCFDWKCIADHHRSCIAQCAGDRLCARNLSEAFDWTDCRGVIMLGQPTRSLDSFPIHHTVAHHPFLGAAMVLPSLLQGSPNPNPRRLTEAKQSDSVAPLICEKLRVHLVQATYTDTLNLAWYAYLR